MAYIVLKPGKQKSVLRFHPWVFSGAIANVIGNPQSGETVDVVDSDQNFLARAAYSPMSQIRARIWSWKADEVIDAVFFRKMLFRSIKARRIKTESGISTRLVYAESDGLPGLIIDQYADTLVFQFLSAGAEYWRKEIIQISSELVEATYTYERSDIEARRLEGLPESSGLLSKHPRTEAIQFSENGAIFEVDIEKGQKTGFYLDQAVNRMKLRAIAKGSDALDCFCYTGGFTINLLLGGAKTITAIDSSESAIAQAQRHVILNGFAPDAVNWREADVFRYLRELRDRNLSFDLIVLDPPKFAQNASQIEKASRAYKDINLLALKLLRPGGYLATFSCSGTLDASLFQKIVAGAAVDAHVNAQIIDHYQQAQDHPVALFYPEAAYLKGLLVRVAF